MPLRFTVGDVISTHISYRHTIDRCTYRSGPDLVIFWGKVNFCVFDQDLGQQRWRLMIFEEVLVQADAGVQVLTLMTLGRSIWLKSDKSGGHRFNWMNLLMRDAFQFHHTLLMFFWIKTIHFGVLAKPYHVVYVQFEHFSQVVELSYVGNTKYRAGLKMIRIRALNFWFEGNVDLKLTLELDVHHDSMPF